MLTSHYEAYQAERRAAAATRPPGSWETVSGAEWCFGRAVPQGAGLARGDALKPGLVRREACEWLVWWDLRSLVDGVSVVLSELVTNAIRYGNGSEVAVRMHLLRRLDSDALRIEVCDGSTDLPSIRDAGPDSEGGRGLVLVEGLLAEFGGTYAVSDDGRQTWCVIPVPRTVW